MWHCSHCNEILADTFDSCWKCGRNRGGTASDHFTPEANDPSVPDPGPSADELRVDDPDEWTGGTQQYGLHEFSLRRLPLSRSLRIIGGVLFLMPVAGFLLACLGMEWLPVLIWAGPAGMLEPILPKSAMVQTPVGVFLSPWGFVLVYFIPGACLLAAGMLGPLYRATRSDAADQGNITSAADG